MSEQTKNKIFWWVFAILILGSVIFTYIRVFINKDYIIIAEVYCDPEVESCFHYSVGELTEIEYYKIIHKKAYNISNCNSNTITEGEICPELICEEGESEEECFYEYNE